MKKAKDLTNRRFGKLIALKSIGVAKSRHLIWLCKCDCGNTINTESRNLLSGNTKSCGCFHIEQVSKCTRYDFAEIRREKTPRLYRFGAT